MCLFDGSSVRNICICICKCFSSESTTIFYSYFAFVVEAIEYSIKVSPFKETVIVFSYLFIKQKLQTKIYIISPSTVTILALATICCKQVIYLYIYFYIYTTMILDCLFIVM